MTRARGLSLMLACLTVGAVLATALAPSALGGFRARRQFFGLGGWNWPSHREVRKLSHRGLRQWRLTLAWGDVERSPGTYGWAGYDQVIADLVSHRMSVLLDLTGCPDWVCHRGGFGPPRPQAARQRWLAFVRAAVQRYGTNGSFWGSHPGLAYRPVRYWQVLNEVNGADQWPNPSAADYAALLKPTSATIRSVDPSSKVVLAGLGKHMTILLKDYLPALYQQRGFSGDVDAIAVEGYAERPRQIVGIMRLTRGIMRRYGDRRTPVWITEMGWATGGGNHPYVTSRRGQAKKLRLSWDMLYACRRHWRLKRVYWFPHRDQLVPPGGTDYWGYHNGLITVGGRWKPAMRTLLHYVRKRMPRGHRMHCRSAIRATR